MGLVPKETDRRSMNTLCHLSAFIALIWGSLYCFKTLKEPELGFAILVLVGLWFVLTLLAIDDDVYALWGKSVLRRHRE